MARPFWLIALVLTLGCGQAEKLQAPAQDPDDTPITEADVKIPANYAEALPRIRSYHDAIRNAIASGTPGKAHRALDELDIVLDKLPTIAKNSGVPKEQWEAVNVSARSLRNAFNALHSAMDEKRPPDYEAVAATIDQALATLEQVTL